jgi:hypothetical protein
VTIFQAAGRANMTENLRRAAVAKQAPERDMIAFRFAIRRSFDLSFILSFVLPMLSQ